MTGVWTCGAGLIAVAAIVASSPATAVVLGTPSFGGGATVQIVRGGHTHCSGAVIARTAVVTAAHCAGGGVQVLAGGQPVAVVGRSHSAVLDDGRRVSVAGDAVILVLAAPVAVSPVAVGDGRIGDSVTIAGYGTTDEAQPGATGALNEARLVPGPGRQLVDPNRSGKFSASACFGDSGGPVLRNGVLVGVVTRANYPNARNACGWYTRYAPVRASGTPAAPAATAFAAISTQLPEAPRDISFAPLLERYPVVKPTPPKRRVHRRRR